MLVQMTQPDHQRSLEAIAHCLRKIEQEIPELMTRKRLASRDGYPSSSSPVACRGGGGPARPTEAAALGEGSRDPVNADHRFALNGLRDAAELLAKVANVTAQYVAHRCEQCRVLVLPGSHCACTHDEGKCASCARFGISNATHRRGRCRGCYDHGREHDNADPPEALIRAREERRVYR